MKKAILAVLLLFALLAGCTGPTPIENGQRTEKFKYNTPFEIQGKTNYESTDGQLVLENTSLGPCVPGTQCTPSAIKFMARSAGNSRELSFEAKENTTQEFSNYVFEIISISKGGIGKNTIKITKVQANTIPIAFELGKEFTIKENNTYINSPNDFTINSISFADSRCPTGVQCVWEGELGVNFSVFVKDEFGQKWKENIYLGQSRSPKKNVAGFDINLS